MTYSDSLEQAGLNLFGPTFGGVYSSDTVSEAVRLHAKAKPRLPANLRRYFITNLDRSDQPGSHWIAVVSERPTAVHPKGRVFVYDSFGRDSSEIIPSLTVHLSENGGRSPLDSDPDAEQRISENNCGARTLAYLVVMHLWGPAVANRI